MKVNGVIRKVCDGRNVSDGIVEGRVVRGASDCIVEVSSDVIVEGLVIF